MRKNQLNGLMNDFVNYLDYANPLSKLSIPNKLKVNLLTGEVFYIEEDSFYDFYKKKAAWFLSRIKKLGGNLEDFEKAELLVIGSIEKIKIKYKNKDFEGSKSF